MQVGVPVRGDRDVMSGRKGGDSPPLGDATGDACVGLEDVGRVPVDELREAPARGLDLTGCDRDRRARGKQAVVGDVVGREGLLDPPDVVLADRLYGARRLLDESASRC